MAKAGSTKAVTTKEKDFAGTGVEGQKGAGAKQDDKADTNPAPPAGDSVNAKPDSKADAKPAEPEKSEIVRGEDVLKRLRSKGHQV